MITARRFAHIAHGNQMYRDNSPHVDHLDRVASHFPIATAEWIVAYLHDILEDTGVTYDDLVDLFGIQIASYVRTLSKNYKSSIHMREGYEVEDHYYYGVKGNGITRAVKLADLCDNLTHCIINLDEGVEGKDWRRKASEYAKRIRYLETK